VQRNRMDGSSGSNIRFLKERLTKGLDIIVVARKADKASNFESIGKEMRYLLKKLDILSRENDD
jgi:ribonuclease P protein component